MHTSIVLTCIGSTHILSLSLSFSRRQKKRKNVQKRYLSFFGPCFCVIRDRSQQLPAASEKDLFSLSVLFSLTHFHALNAHNNSVFSVTWLNFHHHLKSQLIIFKHSSNSCPHTCDSSKWPLSSHYFASESIGGKTRRESYSGMPHFRTKSTKSRR